jgi:SPP1 family phage portal protein
MIQISNLETIKATDIQNLLAKINPILNKRKVLYNERYKRLASSSDMFSVNDTHIKVALESYIGDMTTGYFGGKEPKYEVLETQDEEKRTILNKVFGKLFNNENYKKEMELLIQYITDYNDDGTTHYELVKDYFLKSAGYQVLYENEDNEIVYATLDALQTVAIWDYNTPSNLIGLVRVWDEEDNKTQRRQVVEITDINGTRVYKQVEDKTGKKIFEEYEQKNNNWGDVPAIAVEQPEGLAIFESVISLIDAYQRVVQNARNTFQYNDEAKLKVTGYTPTNNLTTVDDQGNIIANPERELEDALLLESKVFYTPDASGDIEWIEKTIQDGAITNHKKTLIDLISMISGVPNMSDLGFTNADNASAIDRKFFNLEQKITIADKLFKKAYLRKWELIFGRINLKKNTKYDFRDVKVKLYRNLPTDKYTETTSALSLRGLLSDATVIDMLPYELDPISEMNKIEQKEEPQIAERIQEIQEIEV